MRLEDGCTSTVLSPSFELKTNFLYPEFFVSMSVLTPVVLQSRVIPDLTTCSILINAFGKAREWEKIDLVLADMETYGIKADLMVYNSLISVYGKAGLFYEVDLVVKSLRAEIARLEELGNNSLAMDLVTYNTLLDVHGKGGRLNDVIYWFAEMKKAGVQPDVLTFNSLVNAYGKASHYDGVCPACPSKSCLLYCAL